MRKEKISEHLLDFRTHLPYLTLAKILPRISDRPILFYYSTHEVWKVSMVCPMMHRLQMLKSEFFICVFSFSRPCGLHLPGIFSIWPLQRKEPLWYPHRRLSHHPFMPEFLNAVSWSPWSRLQGPWRVSVIQNHRTTVVTSGTASPLVPPITHCTPAIWPPAVPWTPEPSSFPGTWPLKFSLPGMFFHIGFAHILHVIFPVRLALSRLLKIIAVP